MLEEVVSSKGDLGGGRGAKGRYLGEQQRCVGLGPLLWGCWSSGLKGKERFNAKGIIRIGESLLYKSVLNVIRFIICSEK